MKNRILLFMIVLCLLVLPIGFSQQFISTTQQFISEEDNTIYEMREEYEGESIKYHGYIIEFEEKTDLEVKQIEFTRSYIDLLVLIE